MKTNYNELKVIKYSKNGKELEISLGDSIAYIRVGTEGVDQAPAAVSNDLRLKYYIEIVYAEKNRHFGDLILNSLRNNYTSISNSDDSSEVWETKILNNTLWNGTQLYDGALKFVAPEPRVVSKKYNFIYGKDKGELYRKHKVVSDTIIDNIESYINVVNKKWNINERVTVFDHQTITYLDFCGFIHIYLSYPNNTTDLNDRKPDIISSFSKIDSTDVYTGWIKIPAKSKDPKLRDIIDCFSFPDICNTFDVKSSSNYSIHKYTTDTLTYSLYKIDSEIDPIKQEMDKIHNLLIERAMDYDKYIKTI